MGGLYTARTEDGREYVLRAKKKFRRQRLVPLVGDRVLFTPGGISDEHGWVEEILPRANLFVRPPVANVTLLCVVVSPSPGAMKSLRTSDGSWSEVIPGSDMGIMAPARMNQGFSAIVKERVSRLPPWWTAPDETSYQSLPGGNQTVLLLRPVTGSAPSQMVEAMISSPK